MPPHHLLLSRWRRARGVCSTAGPTIVQDDTKRERRRQRVLRLKKIPLPKRQGITILCQQDRLLPRAGSANTLRYREELPPNCPPESAVEIAEPATRYRLSKSRIAQNADFDSYARQRGSPNPSLRRTPCEQHGISLFTSLQAARNLLNSSYNRDGRWQAIGELTIPPGAGKMIPPEPSGHQTWWPSQEFDPSDVCREAT